MLPVTRLIVAAYTAEGAIERIHDLTSLEVAARAMEHLAKVMIETPPPVHEAAFASLDPRGRRPPTLADLHVAFLGAVGRLHRQVHPAA